jgi:predicted DNA-binding transcriptional regulator
VSKKVDKVSDKELFKKLEEIGLTEKEARVYIALLSNQNSGSSALIRATKLHGQFVYAALERLEELGLAKHAVQNGRKKFSANPPLRLLGLVEEKRMAAQTVAQALENRFTGQSGQDFEVYQGRSAFVAHELALLGEAPKGGALDIIGGGGNNYMDTMGFEMNEYEKRRIEKDIAIRYVSSPAQGPYLQIMAQNRPNFEYALFPNLQNGLVDTHIWPDKVTINTFGTPPLSFMIKSADIAFSYKGFFEALWMASR